MSQADDSRLLNIAQELVRELSDRAWEIELNRNIPKDLAAQLADAGLFNMCAPKEYGGAAACPLTYAKVVETLAGGDASAAWCSFIATSTAFAYASGGDDTVKALLSERGVIFAGAFAPMGKAVEHVQDGVSGYLVSGEWAWGSGSQNANWISGGCVLHDAAGSPQVVDGRPPRILHMLFASDQVTFQDTWHVMGLRGTGSTQFSVREAFVPADRVIMVKDTRRREHAVFHFPMYGMLSIGIGSVALGIAQTALSEAKKVAMTKKSAMSNRRMLERSSVRIGVAQSEVSLRAARALFHQEIVAAWRAAINDEVDISHRVALRLSINFAVETAKHVTRDAFELIGGAAIYSESAVQRQLRDVQVAGQHVMVGEGIYDVAGRYLLNLPSDHSMM